MNQGNVRSQCNSGDVTFVAQDCPAFLRTVTDSQPVFHWPIDESRRSDKARRLAGLRTAKW